MAASLGRIATLLCVLLAATGGWFAVAASAGAVELTASPERPNSRQQVRVPIDVRDPDGLGALELELVYDPSVLEFEALDGDVLLESALLEHQLLEQGRVRCALISSEPIVKDGTLLVALFAARATEGTTDLALENVMAWDHENVLEMLVHTEGGALELAPEGGAPPVGFLVAVLAGVALLVLVAKLRRR